MGRPASPGCDGVAGSHEARSWWLTQLLCSDWSEWGRRGALIGAKSPCPPSLRVQPCPELNAAFSLDTQHSLEPIDPCVKGCEDDSGWNYLV